ncbi:helix-turn-helix domain-containing protein [Bacillus sp. FJAT-27445]|uniref:helix-turn-helix domain-containing protein n=1 Tax=Bacillus sp. FJAT-27445 TaxID=1679166 RepID=UPI000743596C|nr:helix-turn-helix domain-containing protein [Bacillus sp. FJAT-27445]
MLGARIKELRLQRGYSISELAKLADVSKSYLSQIERGIQKNPSLQFLNKVAATLDTSIEFLLGSHAKENQPKIVLDHEWEQLIQEAIKDGMKKEDFTEYRKYIKYETWRKEKHSINDGIPEK